MMVCPAIAQPPLLDYERSLRILTEALEKEEHWLPFRSN